MKIWTNLKFRLKLFTIFSVILFLFLVGFTLVFFQVNNVNEQQKTLESTNKVNFLVMEVGTVINNKYIAVQDAERSGLFYQSKYDKDEEKLKANLDLIKASVTNKEQKEIFNRIVGYKEDYNGMISEIVGTEKGSEEEELEKKLLLSRLDGLRTLIIGNIREFSDLISKEMTSAGNQVDAAVSSTKLILAAAFVSAFILGGILILIFSHSITKKLTEVVEIAESVSKGDLNVRKIEVKTKDELGNLSSSVNGMIDSLRQLVLNISKSSEQIAAATEELSASSIETGKSAELIFASSQQVAAGAENQLQSANLANQTAADITDSMEKINDNILSVSSASMEMLHTAQIGNEVIEKTINHMKLIGERTENTSGLVYELGVKSKEINRIVSMITEISEQTNLLALNAAIEAARAGDHGKGFAVVANEVRRLAEQSGLAAAQINNLINAIQENIEQSVHSMSEGSGAVTEGVALVDNAGKTFANITTAIHRVTEEIGSVKELTGLVSDGAKILADSINETKSIAEEAAESTNQVASSAENQNASMEEIIASSQTLANIAEELRTDVSSFKL